MSSDIYTNFIVIKHKALTKFHLHKKWALAKFLHIVFLFLYFSETENSKSVLDDSFASIVPSSVFVSQFSISLTPEMFCK